MTTYELVFETNEKLIHRYVFTDAEKKNITDKLLCGVSDKNTIDQFHHRIKTPNDEKKMYPLFYIPPYNDGKKYRLITGQMPKTHILSANHYELEILRILALWRDNDESVKYMLDETIKRLDTTCFAHFCPEGECIGAGVAVLRFLSAYNMNTDWINKLIIPLGEIFLEAKGQASKYKNLHSFYFCLALYDVKSELGIQIMRKRSDFLLVLLKKGWLVAETGNDKYNPLLKYILRNTLSRLPEYEYLKDAEIYISDKDGRCYCNA